MTKTRRMIIIWLGLFVILTVALLICSKGQRVKVDGVVYDEFAPGLSIEAINEFLKKRSPGRLSEAHIMKSRIQEGYYIIVDYSGRDSEVLLYENSIGLIETGIGGLNRTFSFREITLSQGDLLEVFSAGSMGTGYLNLYKNNNTFDLAYFLDDTYATDINMDSRSYEELPESVLDKQNIEKGCLTSWIYANGNLNVVYNDYNNDGHTDIRLYGIKQTLVSTDTQSTEVIAEELYICYYLYNPETDEFILNEEL